MLPTLPPLSPSARKASGISIPQLADPITLKYNMGRRKPER
jgi:hypothetical protein